MYIVISFLLRGRETAAGTRSHGVRALPVPAERPGFAILRGSFLVAARALFIAIGSFRCNNDHPAIPANRTRVSARAPAQPREQPRGEPMPVRTVAILVYEGVQALDVAGPVDVFAEASRLLPPDEGYESLLVAETIDPVRTSNGTRILPDRCLEHAKDSFAVVLVAGGECLYNGVRPSDAILDWLSSAAARADLYGAVCAGAFALGHAGLLDHRSCTTHWGAAAALARDFPRAKVDSDRIFVRDGRLVTSAGITAGIDMALALVTWHHGPGVALAVAKHLVVVAQRRGGQSQFSPFLAEAPHEESLIGRVQAHVLDHLGAPLSVEALAAVTGMSVRSFARHFAGEANMTPREYVERARIDAARNLLEAGALPLKAVAYDCGFGDADRMRAVFSRRLGVTPADYREQFRASRSA
jgi:transcriptional regulator GlxA family with amidase domain